MDKKQVTQALKKVKETSTKRNFKQSVDLIINLKNIDLKKPDHKVDFFMQLGHPNGKEIKICALVGPELKESAKANCDEVVLQSDFKKYTDKKEIKKLADSFLGLVALLILAKYLAAKFASIIFHYRKKATNIMWSLSIPQVAATLAAALVLMAITAVLGAILTERFAKKWKKNKTSISSQSRKVRYYFAPLL